VPTIAKRRLHQVCRCIACPALVNERVQCNVAGHVLVEAVTSCHEDNSHLVLAPLELMRLPSNV